MIAAHFKLGQQLRTAGQLAEAAAHLERAFDLNQRNQDAIDALGWLYYGQKQYDLAIQAFQKEVAFF